MQNRKDSLILKQKGNYIPLLKHGESVQVNMAWIVNEKILRIYI